MEGIVEGNSLFQPTHVATSNGTENQQALIYVKESDEIIRKLLEVQPRRIQDHDYLDAGKDEYGMQQQASETIGRATGTNLIPLSI